MNIRDGMTVYKVGKAEHIEASKGRDCLLGTEHFKTINTAKKANGLNARTRLRGERLPPTPQAYMMQKAENELIDNATIAA